MKKKLLVEGMTCGHCVNHVKEALGELDGITNIEVDLESKSALFDATENVNDEKIKEIITEYGYEVVNIEVI